MEIQDTRRKRLSDWVTANGGYAAVVRAKNLTTSQASFLSQVVNGYSFGERAARAMEKRLGLSPSYLDNKDADNADRLARLSPRAVEVAALFDALPPKRQRLIYAQIQDMHNPDDDAAEDFSATLRQHPPRPAKCGLFFTLNSSVRLTQHQVFAKFQQRIRIAPPGHRRAAGGSREAQRTRSVHVRRGGGRGARPPRC